MVMDAVFQNSKARVVLRKVRGAIGALVGESALVVDPDVVALSESGLFDSNYYLSRYTDVAAVGFDPVDHYVNHGVKEGRDPSPWFQTKYYLSSNPDIAKAGVNPFRHFCEYGWRELRNPSPQFDVSWYWLAYMAGDNIPGNPLAHFLVNGGPDGYDVRGENSLSSADRERMADAALALIRAGQCDVVQLQALARVGVKIGRQELVEGALSRLAVLSPDNAGYQEQLAAVHASQGKWWLVTEALQRAIALERKPEWLYRLGVAYEAMRRFDMAAEAFGSAVELQPRRAEWHYRLGYCLERHGRMDAAQKAYARSVSLHAKGDVTNYGVGVLHQKRGLWEAACVAYEREIKRSPLSAGLHYRLGHAYERCYEWNKALDAYDDAIHISTNTGPAWKASPLWHYRRGFALERMHRWRDAASAYSAACALGEEKFSYWRYRQGYVLAKAGDFAAACLAFLETRQAQTLSGARLSAMVADEVTEDLCQPDPAHDELDKYMAKFGGDAVFVKMVDLNNLDPNSHYRLGQCREHAEDWMAAAEAYGAAIERCSDFKSAWRYRRGFCLYMAGAYEAACEAFLDSRVYRHAHGASEKDMATKALAIQYSTIYAEYRETLAIRENVILYESHIGSSVSCNPYAIFKALVDDPAYADYLHVWVLNDPKNAPESLRTRKNVVLVARPSDGYFRWLASAKYLINNTGFPPYFVRKPAQRYLATWHGTPLKTLGKQQQYKFLEHKRTQRTFLHATHLISPNPHTTDVLLDSYDIRHIAGGMLGETGYPRIDLTLNADDARKAEIRAALGVSGKRPVVLYAPTWRGTLETVTYDVEKVGREIDYLSARHDCDIVFRGHHLLEKAFSINSEGIDGVVAPSHIDTNELLSVVDVLITDYSSIFFDFLPLKRPILYHTYDEAEYRSHRGMYFTMEEMPGYKCADLGALSDSLALALQGKLHDDAQHQDAIRRFCPHEDGKATQRTIQLFFNDAADCVVAKPDNPPIRILINGGGLKRNGITTSFLNLISHLDPARVHVTVAVSAEAVEKDGEARGMFARIPECCGVVGRHFYMTMTLEERRLKAAFDRAETPFEGERLERIRDLFHREYLHNFDNARFDAVIAFSGYDAYWASVLGLNRCKVHKAIYLHNEMYEEYQVRYPELLRIFHTYPFYDRIVSVSPENNKDNRRMLGAWLGIDSDSFTSSENVQNPERILSLSLEQIAEADEAWFSEGPVFVNMARLSVEKGQDRLIRAFASINAEYPDTRLLILGEGPLRGALEALVATLGLQGRVLLPGVRDNPYPYLKRSSCFVLSSHHEAKTMSLIEAMIIGLPFVATDIVGNRDIRNEFPENFFDASEEGMIDGMKLFISGGVHPAKFDWKAHQEVALGQFFDQVLGGIERRTCLGNC